MNKMPEIVERAWLEYQKKLSLFIGAKVETAEDTEDILNDVFVKLAKKISENDIPDNIGSWLYHVTKNRIIDYYRAKKRFEQISEEFPAESVETNSIRELSKCMLPMIQALPETYQQPLLLSEIEGKKYKEVADELGLTLSAVKSRILRGREKLHKSLLSCCMIYHNKAGKIVNY